VFSHTAPPELAALFLKNRQRSSCTAPGGDDASLTTERRLLEASFAASAPPLCPLFSMNCSHRERRDVQEVRDAGFAL
jgi:hypothetical protein